MPLGDAAGFKHMSPEEIKSFYLLANRFCYREASGI
jgi:hypothetical protein